MTQLELARQGTISDEMRLVAQEEGVAAAALRDWVAAGRVVIPANVNHPGRHPYGVGEPLRVKINANIGTSPRNASLEHELRKLAVVRELGAESVMDLSIAGDLDALRAAVVQRAGIMVGSVPVYEVMTRHAGDVERVSHETLLETIERHGRQGIDFVTVHCGLTRAALPLVAGRTMGIVSRGGSFLARWMQVHRRENPLYEHFDELLAVARRFDVTLSLGDALRPGAIVDAGDEAQLHELRVMGELTRRARAAGVQVMVEGPGHVPLDQIHRQVMLYKERCDGAPLYVLGPLSTDRAPGYDHIAGAIGGALAAYLGASFLCYVTPAEHLRLPSIEDVREGVIAARIAAHSADLARGNRAALEQDARFSAARRRFDWEAMYAQAIDGRKPRAYRSQSTHADAEECSMCGELCAMKTMELDRR